MTDNGYEMRRARAERQNDGSKWTPEDVLRAAIDGLDFERINKLTVIYEITSNDGKHAVEHLASKMNIRDLVYVIEAKKFDLLMEGS